MQPLTKGEPANPQVVALLQHWLEMAKLGQINFVALAGVQSHLQVSANFTGTRGLEFAANWGLDILKLRIIESIDAAPEALEPSATADRVCFNFTTGSTCFDFLVWLVIAEMRRRVAGAPAPLKVAFRFDRQEDQRAPITKYRQQMFEKVMRPSLAFLGAVEDKSAIDGEQPTCCTLFPIVEAAKAKHPVPRFVPSEMALQRVKKAIQGGEVTITLREAELFPHRNSNLAHWLKLAELLRAQGEKVVFVRDTAKAHEPIPGFPTLPNASIDLDFRLALYESAKCNLFVANGPWTLACFGTRPYLMFNAVSPLDTFVPNTPAWWKQFQGIGPGEQLPWATPEQRIIWHTDDFEIMRSAWSEMSHGDIHAA